VCLQLLEIMLSLSIRKQLKERITEGLVVFASERGTPVVVGSVAFPVQPEPQIYQAAYNSYQQYPPYQFSQGTSQGGYQQLSGGKN